MGMAVWDSLYYYYNVKMFVNAASLLVSVYIAKVAITVIFGNNLWVKENNDVWQGNQS